MLIYCYKNGCSNNKSHELSSIIFAETGWTWSDKSKVKIKKWALEQSRVFFLMYSQAWISEYLQVLVCWCVRVRFVLVSGPSSWIELRLGRHLSRRRKVGVELRRGEGWDPNYHYLCNPVWVGQVVMLEGRRGSLSVCEWEWHLFAAAHPFILTAAPLPLH